MKVLTQYGTLADRVPGQVNQQADRHWLVMSPNSQAHLWSVATQNGCNSAVKLKGRPLDTTQKWKLLLTIQLISGPWMKGT